MISTAHQPRQSHWQLLCLLCFVFTSPGASLAEGTCVANAVPVITDLAFFFKFIFIFISRHYLTSRATYLYAVSNSIAKHMEYVISMLLVVPQSMIIQTTGGAIVK